MKMKNETYDKLKFLCLTLIPALIVLLGTVGNAMGWTWVATAQTIIGAIGTFIGSCLHISSSEYNKGE